jgi:hypothetical protein
MTLTEGLILILCAATAVGALATALSALAQLIEMQWRDTPVERNQQYWDYEYKQHTFRK